MQTKDYRGRKIMNRGGKVNDWFTRDGKGRTRWGTIGQIRADIDSLLDFGHFPPKSRGWA